MLRTRLTDSLKTAMKSRNERSTSTLRLILAAIKDRDIAAKSKGNRDGVSNDEVLGLLQSMIKQRHESIEMYEKGRRPELAQREAEEITVIEGFLPKQLSDDELAQAIQDVIADVEAESLKDMGKAMGALKEKYTGRIDFSKASAMVKERLN